MEGSKSSWRLNFLRLFLVQYLRVRSRERAACHLAGACNFEVSPRFLENLWALPQVLYFGRICFYLLATGIDVFLMLNTVQILETKNHKIQYKYGPLWIHYWTIRSRRRHDMWSVSLRKQSHLFRRTKTVGGTVYHVTLTAAMGVKYSVRTIAYAKLRRNWA
jgi:hypothetical protein